MWPFRNKAEKRNFTDLLINQITASTESVQAKASASSALEIAAGHLSRALLMAEINGTNI